MEPLYDPLAQYYDIVHKSVTADIPFFVSLAREAGSPVLEIGCGTGRTLVHLAKAGIEAAGLDNSPAMLERAGRRLEELAPGKPVHLTQGEMTDFDLGRQFGLIIIPLNTWLHLPDTKSRSAALKCFHRHLLPGGRLVIDTPGLESIVDVEHDGALILEELFVMPDTGETLMQFASSRLDPEAQVLDVTWIYDRLRKDGTVHRTVAPMALSYLYPQQYEQLLERNGLALEAFWGNYERSAYTAASERLIVVAVRP